MHGLHPTIYTYIILYTLWYAQPTTITPVDGRTQLCKYTNYIITTLLQIKYRRVQICNYWYETFVFWSEDKT